MDTVHLIKESQELAGLLEPTWGLFDTGDLTCDATGGRTPYDKENAAVGPARVLWAEPDQALPADLWEIIPAVADADGEYPAVDGWHDFGLAADAPSYTHGKDTEGLQYQQSAAALFEQVSEITREFTAQVAEISPDNLMIMENSNLSEAVAAAANKSALTLVHTGNYESLRQLRIALIFYRPSGAGAVTEPAPSPVGTRPPAIARVFPLVQLAAEDTDVEIDREDPVNMEITFSVRPDSAAGAGKEHGYWAVESPGVILAA